MKRSLLLPLALAAGLGSPAQAAERDYIGWSYDPKTFPPCQTYGCKVLGEQAVAGRVPGDDSSSFLHLQLLRLDAKVTLILDASRTITGIYVLLPGKTLSQTGQNFLQRVLVKSANEEFAPHVLPQCFARLHPLPKEDL